MTNISEISIESMSDDMSLEAIRAKRLQQMQEQHKSAKPNEVLYRRSLLWLLSQIAYHLSNSEPKRRSGRKTGQRRRVPEQHIVTGVGSIGQSQMWAILSLKTPSYDLSNVYSEHTIGGQTRKGQNGWEPTYTKRPDGNDQVKGPTSLNFHLLTQKILDCFHLSINSQQYWLN